MVRAGRTPEETARTLRAERLQLEQEFRRGLPAEIVEEIELRQLERYGNRSGPTVEYLLGRGRTWEEIAEGAMRPGGRDLLRLFFGE
jgi:hypothetical protein